MRLLLTGSAGFAGAHFVDHVLANTDWEIIGIDSFKHRGDSLRVYQDSRRYTVYTHDLTTPISARLADKIGPIDAIVNMASESHVDRSINDPVSFIQNNVSVALMMLEYARVTHPRFFFQISTDEVYGPAPDHVNHKEWSTLLPSNPYAASKAAQEAIAISYWRTYGVPLIITNTMNLIGERQDKEKFVPMLISKIQAGETVTIHGNMSKVGSRHYLHCRNMADAILFLMNNTKPAMYSADEGVDRPSRYNIVGDKEITNLDLAFMVGNILKKAVKYDMIDFHSARPGHDLRYSLDGKLLREMGWRAPVPLESALERVVGWTLDHKEWLK